MERLADDDVIVVRGHSDKVEDVLRAINVKHKLIDADEVKGLKLDPRSVLILNCNSRDNPYGDAEFAKIASSWTRRYLFTSTGSSSSSSRRCSRTRSTSIRR